MAKRKAQALNSIELTSAVTALANALACRLGESEIAFLAAILVQLGDTLATIAALHACEQIRKDEL